MGTNPTASEMAKARWKGSTMEERSEHARKMAKARWKKYAAPVPKKVPSTKSDS